MNHNHYLVDEINSRFERFEEILNKMESRLESLEENLGEKLDSLELNMSPLLDLLNTLIKNNISVETVEEEPKEVKPELAYRVNGDNIYIYGKKTYDNRDLIKSTFRNAGWSKENSAWTFNSILNPDYENKLNEFFPSIIKGQ
tara:strand:- start:1316 stop:1744 length:429 start_codon:yes stop_codon:yes gene_type:complete